MYSCDHAKYNLLRKVFDAMRKRNVVAWSTLVSWYAKTERNEYVDDMLVVSSAIFTNA